VFSVVGRGPVTYVCIAGITGGVHTFRRLRARLVERGGRVVLVDPYRLSVDSADVNFVALARRVDALLAAHGVDSARVLGHGHGAGVAMRLAANSPRRVAALYLMEGGAMVSNRTPAFSSSMRIAPLINRLPGGRGFLRGRFLKGIRENSGSAAWLDSATRHDYVEPVLDNLGRVVSFGTRLNAAEEPEPLAAVLARVRVPVTVILGGAPHATAPTDAELSALSALPGGPPRVVRVPGAGYFPHEESPAVVAERLLEPPR
jgi:pimeloyl-ACP methyl ester carboxylesterase